jgi:hypothetical protein
LYKFQTITLLAGQLNKFFLQVKAPTNTLQSIRVIVGAATALQAQGFIFFGALYFSSTKKNKPKAKLQYCRRLCH